MKKYVVITITALLLGGCGYKGSLIVKDNEVLAKSNRPMEITKVIDKDGNTSVTYSSKKAPGFIENLLTIIGLKATK